MLGVPMVPVVAKTGRGLEALLDTVIAVYENRDPRVRHIHINNGPVVEQALRPLYERLRSDRDEAAQALPAEVFRHEAARTRQGRSKRSWPTVPISPSGSLCATVPCRRSREELGEDVETALANQKYGFISGALKETFTPGGKEQAQTTHIIDAFVTHKLWGSRSFSSSCG